MYEIREKYSNAKWIKNKICSTHIIVYAIMKMHSYLVIIFRILFKLKMILLYILFE